MKKKALKTALKTITVIVVLAVLFVLITFTLNKVLLNREKSILRSLGQSVVVDNGFMNVYTEGDGEKTLVFLAGSCTPSPILDFKSLYSLLSDEYRIVVIERFGYGCSDNADSARSFSTILRQDREALEKAGIEGPFVLCPHSMAGLEAILWAQEYPEEVEAIAGLDMALPRAYDNFDIDGAVKKKKLVNTARKLGFLRLVNTVDMYDAMTNGVLRTDEIEIYRMLLHAKLCNEDTIDELTHVRQACLETDSRPVPDVPTILFVSNGEETGVDNWTAIQNNYVLNLTRGKAVELGCGHYVHNLRQAQIAEKLKDFLSGSEE